MKPLPLLPLKYLTSDEVRSGISHAYSGVFNPRSLEKIWHGPWGHMLSELASTYNGHLIAHCQYPLWIPSLLAEERYLREALAVHGIDFELGVENLDDYDSDTDTSAVLAGLHLNDGRKRSERLAAHKITKEQKAAQEKKDTIKGLLKRRSALYDTELENYESKSLGPDVSIESVLSQREGEAINKEPDFVLSHIGHYELPLPLTPESLSHYTHRAGVKVFHHCCPLIVELKPPPPRFCGVSHFEPLVNIRFLRAAKDLIEYCAAYFECNSEPRSVIALAGAGPYWKWHVVYRNDIPVFDTKLKEPYQADDPKAVEFLDKFKRAKHFTLGTPESDEEISRINKEHIFPMFKDGHYKVVTPN